MFADLDDRTPPSADDAIRRRVDRRAREVEVRDRRNRRLARVGLVVAVIAFVALAGALVLVARSGGSQGSDPVAPPVDVLATWSFTGQPTPDDEQVTVDRLNQRFASSGVEATAALVDDQVVVTVPSGQQVSKESVLALARTGQLEFRPVLLVSSYDENLVVGAAGSIVDPGPDPTGAGPDVRYVLGPAAIDDSAVESVTAASVGGRWELRPVLRAGADGIDAFNALAAQCVQGTPTCPGTATIDGVGPPAGSGQIAVVLDGRVLVAPTVQSASFERDQITIASGLTEASARQLAAIIGSGALPAPLALPAG